MVRIKSRLRSDVIQHNLLFRSIFLCFVLRCFDRLYYVLAHERINFFREILAVVILSHRSICTTPIAISSYLNHSFQQTLTLTPNQIEFQLHWDGNFVTVSSPLDDIKTLLILGLFLCVILSAWMKKVTQIMCLYDFNFEWTLHLTEWQRQNVMTLHQNAVGYLRNMVQWKINLWV